MVKTITISDDVYKELLRIKGDKSFSELFRELLREKGQRRCSATHRWDPEREGV